jgi:CTP synthase
LTTADAASAEFVPTCPNPAIIFMPEISKTHLGGTMRLGLRPTIFASDTESSTIRKLYGGKPEVWERHRHRYEVNPEMVDRLEKGDGKKGGLRFIGKDERGERMQIVEVAGTF